MTISMDKKYQTRDGRAARVLCVDRQVNEHGEVVALVSSGGVERTSFYHPDGKYSGGNAPHMDLIEVKERVTFWVNVYVNGKITWHDSESRADFASNPGAVIIARKVELEVD